MILWLTGLSGSGKTTLANAVGARVARVRQVEVLDGDDIRAHLSKDLGFSKQDRDSNVRRIGLVARLLARHDVFVIVGAISPYAEIRHEVRELAQLEGICFIEIFLNPTIGSLIARDVKGLYKRALAGEIQHFSGISDPYEAPAHPDIMIATDTESVAASVERIMRLLVGRGLLPQLGSFSSNDWSEEPRQVNS